MLGWGEVAMPPLAELQRGFVRALLDDPSALPGRLFATGPVPAASALSVHRNTVLGALCRALALSCPTVRALVGQAFFERAALAFAAERPPRSPSLADYGDDFPEFLETWPPAAHLAFLTDAARLDLAIERTAAAPGLGAIFSVDQAAALSLPVSLQVLALACPADLIRDAIDAGDEDALSAIDLAASPRWLALWRHGAGAAVRPLSPAAGLFLSDLLARRCVHAALDAAAQETSRKAALLAVQAEVFAAPFATVIPLALKEDLS
jgi:hypothetical protein